MQIVRFTINIYLSFINSLVNMHIRDAKLIKYETSKGSGQFEAF